MKKESFELHIGMLNSAFDDEPLTELARILRDLASKLEAGEALNTNALRDVNGNVVGRYTFNNR